MTTANTQLAIVPGFYQLSVYNASTVADIPPDTAVIIDVANNMNAATIANAHLAVTLPGATTSSNCIGITSETIYSGGTGKITPVGPVSRGICYGTVNAGSAVDNCTVSGFTGSVQAHVASSRQMGIAVVGGVHGDKTILILTAAVNA